MTDKEFRKNYIKLKRFIKGQLKLRLVNGTVSTYQFKINTIILGRNQPLDIILFSLLHEIGHHCLKIINPKLYQTDLALDSLSSVIFNRPLTVKEKDFIVNNELMAWEKGEQLAQLLNIQLSNSYYKFRDKCINEYKELKEQKK